MTSLRTIMKKLTAGILAVTFVTATCGQVLQPPRAHAIPVQVTIDTSFASLISMVKNTITAAGSIITSLNISALSLKEYTLDPITFWIARLILNEIRKSTIRWINSGFQGSPAFVTDLEGFLLGVADKIIGEFIYGSELSFLCSPLELDIRIAVAVATKEFKEEIQCTLSGVVDNVEEFFQGDYLAGGNAGWFEVTQNPNNNFYGAQASAKAAIRGRLADGRQVELNLLDWGDGLFSKKGDCISIAGDPKCTITMPGKAISEALTVQVGNDSQALLTADEINEVVMALFSQMTVQALQGAAGLLGLGRSNSNYGGRSYLDAVGSDAYDSSGGRTVSGGISDPIANAIADEEAYQALYEPIQMRAQDLLDEIEEFENPGPDSRQGDNDPRTCSVPNRIITRTTSIRDQAAQRIQNATSTISLLQGLQLRQLAADQNPDQIAGAEERIAVLNEFTTLQATGVLHGRIVAAQDEFEVKELDDELGELEAALEEACNGDDRQSSGDGGG